ncbi:response regulator [Luteolibacter marinus]|uniref:response regulator n=1 Tax=Luteolibacter marinus TaxID=2776705 RepID=UPI0018682EA6
MLVVDDEPTLRLGFSYALADHETDTASGGQEALNKLEQGDYDIVVLDLRMPEVDGLQVIEALRGRGDDLPVVLCSAAVTPAAALRAIGGKVVDFLLKPVCPAELRGVIEYVLQPSGDPLSLAMREARTGRLDEALAYLDDGPADCPRIATWRHILGALRSAEPDRKAAAAAKLEIEGLKHLSFRLPED